MTSPAKLKKVDDLQAALKEFISFTGYEVGQFVRLCDLKKLKAENSQFFQLLGFIISPNSMYLYRPGGLYKLPTEQEIEDIVLRQVKFPAELIDKQKKGLEAEEKKALKELEALKASKLKEVELLKKDALKEIQALKEQAEKEIQAEKDKHSKEIQTKKEALNFSEGEISANNIQIISTDVSNVPDVDKNFVPYGNYKTLDKIIKSESFYPVYMQGTSGVGKTYMVEQLCAKNKRDFVRVNFTELTEEDDLLGGLRLVDDQTKFFLGGVIEAMQTGAVLLLDEFDHSSPKALCLLPVLEGKPVFVKKINKWFKPAPGFQIIATANTKGNGEDDGDEKYVGTSILNEAVLDRFSVFVEQNFPTITEEKKILKVLIENTDGLEMTPEVENIMNALTSWSDVIRSSFKSSILTDVVSTRRIVDIIKGYSIFSNINKAVDLGTSRFSQESSTEMQDSWKKIYKKLNDDKTTSQQSFNNPISTLPQSSTSANPF